MFGVMNNKNLFHAFHSLSLKGFVMETDEQSEQLIKVDIEK